MFCDYFDTIYVQLTFRHVQFANRFAGTKQ